MLRPLAAPLPRLLPLALLVALAACGGTGSETPWPVEPDDVDLGPEGEARRSEAVGGPSKPGSRSGAEPVEEPSGRPGSAPTTAPSSRPSNQPSASPSGNSTPPSAPPSSQF